MKVKSEKYQAKFRVVVAIDEKIVARYQIIIALFANAFEASQGRDFFQYEH